MFLSNFLLCIKMYFVFAFIFSSVSFEIYVHHFLDAVRNQTSNRNYLLELTKRRPKVHQTNMKMSLKVWPMILSIWFKFKKGIYLPWQNKCFNLKATATCHIKPKCFFWTEPLRNSPYEISHACHCGLTGFLR